MRIKRKGWFSFYITYFVAATLLLAWNLDKDALVWPLLDLLIMWYMLNRALQEIEEL